MLRIPTTPVHVTVPWEISDLYFNAPHLAYDALLTQGRYTMEDFLDAIEQDACVFCAAYPHTCGYWDVTASDLAADFYQRLLLQNTAP